MEPLVLLLLLWAFSRSEGVRLDLPSAPRGPKLTPIPSGFPGPMTPLPPLPHATPATYVPTAPPAWPAVLPAGVPPFPGPGWVPDQPVGPGVVARAYSLLSQLWASGEGTHSTEQTLGRWITYVATRLSPTKRGVVAYRLAAPTSVVPTMSAAPMPVPGYVATRGPAPARSVASPPMAPGPAPVPASLPPSTRLPTLQLHSRGPSVVYLQQRLGLSADGDFGPATLRAVKAFQASHGLTTDGVVGHDTWAALGAA